MWVRHDIPRRPRQSTDRLAVSMVGLVAGAAIVAGLLIAVYAALKVA
ncbi:hypothetical protein ACLMAL_02360 [Nocardia sp. CWNU-33]